ncbi:MAG: OmpH family outer membrane protein [Patescibacteria group bacterium]
MIERRMAVILAGAIMLAVAVLGPMGLSAQGKTGGLTAAAIAVIDPATIRAKIPEYARLKDLKKAYENELNGYMVYLQSQLDSFVAELKKKEEVEIEGKSSEEQKAIKARYTKEAQAKQAESNQLIKAKSKELQDKLNAEMAKVDQRVKEIIAAVCREKGLAIALNKDIVLFGGTDITGEVVARSGKK